VEKNPIYFIEVQFHRKPYFYRRLFAEIFTYLYQKEVEIEWQAVVVYPSRAVEVMAPKPYKELMESGRVICVYLDELITNESQAEELNLFRLIESSMDETKRITKRLIEKDFPWIRDEVKRKDWVSLIETILVYKYSAYTRKEIEMLFGLDELRQTKVYQEAFDEGKIEGMKQGVIQAIELGLDLKFGTEGSRLLPEIMKIENVVLLERIRASIKGVQNTDELRSLYQTGKIEIIS